MLMSYRLSNSQSTTGGRPATGRLLAVARAGWDGWRRYREAAGTLHGKMMGSVVLKRAIVNRLGQLPDGE
jgi:hypothetical protein